MERRVPADTDPPDAPKTSVRLDSVLLAITTYLRENKAASLPAMLRGKPVNLRLNSAGQIAYTSVDAPHAVRVLEPREITEVMINLDDARKTVDFLEEFHREKPATKDDEARNAELAGLARNWNTMIAGLCQVAPGKTDYADDAIERKNAVIIELLKKIIDIIAGTVRDIVPVPIGSTPRIIIRGTGLLTPQIEPGIMELAGLLNAQKKASITRESASIELTLIANGQKLVEMFLEILYEINFFGRHMDEHWFLYSETSKLEEHVKPHRGQLKPRPGFIRFSRELKAPKEWELQVGFDCNEQP